MSKWAVLGLAISLATTAAVAQQNDTDVVVRKAVYLGAYNEQNGAFSGYVDVTAQPCPSTNFEQRYSVQNVKTESEAVAWIKQETDKLQTSLNQVAKTCAK